MQKETKSKKFKYQSLFIQNFKNCLMIKGEKHSQKCSFKGARQVLDGLKMS
jgi:hypothetical protein